MEFCWNARPATRARKITSRRKKVRSSNGTLTTDNADDYFYYLEKYKVLVCREHTTGVQNLDAYLYDYHAVPAAARRVIVGKYNCFQRGKPSEVQVLLPLGRPIQELGEPYDGFRCRELDCSTITISKSVLQTHCRTKYQRS